MCTVVCQNLSSLGKPATYSILNRRQQQQKQQKHANHDQLNGYDKKTACGKRPYSATVTSGQSPPSPMLYTPVHRAPVHGRHRGRLVRPRKPVLRRVVSFWPHELVSCERLALGNKVDRAATHHLHHLLCPSRRRRRSRRVVFFSATTCRHELSRERGEVAARHPLGGGVCRSDSRSVCRSDSRRRRRAPPLTSTWLMTFVSLLLRTSTACPSSSSSRHELCSVGFESQVVFGATWKLMRKIRATADAPAGSSYTFSCYCLYATGRSLIHVRYR